MNELRGHRHYGEQAVQQRVGEGGPERGSPMFGPIISANLATFVTQQRIAIIGGPTLDGSVWVSAVSGEAGFIHDLDDRTVEIATKDTLVGPLARAYATAEHSAASLIMDFETARRLRINGRIHADQDILTMASEQVVGNCTKYIHRRRPRDEVAASQSVELEGSTITDEQKGWIDTADTFFIATYSPDHGADVSHRGGPAGFVERRGNILSWPDYKGNSFYMTFGNLEINRSAGLAFLDLSNGHVLSLSGESWVNWGRAETRGNERRVYFRIERVVQTRNALSVKWDLVSMSDHTPPPKEQL